MKEILSKYTERLARKEAKAVDDFIRERIPAWQTKLMLKFPFTRKLFGWEMKERTNNLEEGRFLTMVDLYRWKKPIDTLMITFKIKTK